MPDAKKPAKGVINDAIRPIKRATSLPGLIKM